MANKTVALNSQLYAGTAGLTLLLINPSSGAIGNGSGDALTAGSNGLFTAVVTEAITGWWNVVVRNGSTPILEGGRVFFASDTEGTYVVDDPDSLAPAVTVLPLTGDAIARVSDTTITVFKGEQIPVSVSITGDVDLTTKTLQIVIEKIGTADKLVIADADIHTTATTFTFTVPSSLTANVDQYQWILRELSTQIKLAGGVLLVKAAPYVDAS